MGLSSLWLSIIFPSTSWYFLTIALPPNPGKLSAFPGSVESGRP
jgi:hypothetical protein